MPLSLAVGFAMIDVLLAVQHVRAGPVGLAAATSPSTARRAGPDWFSFARLRDALCAGCCGRSCRSRWLLVPAYLVVGLACSSGWSAASWGTEIFPTVDAGQFQLRLRAADRHAHRAHRADRQAGPGGHQAKKSGRRTWPSRSATSA